jgi:hypothetical protein
MKRIIQPELMRGRLEQRAAILLWLGLVAVLCAAVLTGVHALAF